LKTRDFKLVDQAVSVAQKIDNPVTKDQALRDVATALATGDDEATDSKLLRSGVGCGTGD
jgi:hypothetical protein